MTTDNPQTKRTDLGCESAVGCWRLRSPSPFVTIPRKVFWLSLPGHCSVCDSVNHGVPNHNRYTYMYKTCNPAWRTGYISCPSRYVSYPGLFLWSSSCTYHLSVTYSYLFTTKLLSSLSGPPVCPPPPAHAPGLNVSIAVSQIINDRLNVLSMISCCFRFCNIL